MACAALDARVAAMVGHEPDTNRLYAWSHDGVTYMSSGDEGMTWASTNSDHVAAAKTQLLFKSAKDVPWTDNTLLPAGNPPTSYQQLAWGGAKAFSFFLPSHSCFFLSFLCFVVSTC